MTRRRDEIGRSWLVPIRKGGRESARPTRRGASTVDARGPAIGGLREVAMNERHQALARHVVEEFVATLEPTEQRHLGAARLQGLEQLIVEALASELDMAADRVETLVKELRAEITRPELGL